MLFKHLKTLESYEDAFESLISKAENYLMEEEQEAHFTLKTTELGNIQASLNEIKERTNTFSAQFNDARESVMTVF